MSLFAKIMTVVNLILAVAFLAAAGTFLNATDSWRAKHVTDTGTLTAANEALTAQVDAQRTAADQARTQRDQAMGLKVAAEDKLNVLQDSSVTLNARNAELNSSLETLSSAQKDLQDKNSELQGIINQTRDQLSTAESEKRAAQDEARTAQESIARLEQEVKDANETAAAQEAANQGLREQLDSSRTAVAMYKDKFGPLAEATVMMKSVSGVVQAVDNEMDIYILSVGSQDGVAVGYEFTIYRGDQYIATVVVDKVFPNHASARTKDNMKRKAARAGDNVSTHL